MPFDRLNLTGEGRLGASVRGTDLKYGARKGQRMAHARVACEVPSTGGTGSDLLGPAGRMTGRPSTPRSRIVGVGASWERRVPAGHGRPARFAKWRACGCGPPVRACGRDARVVRRAAPRIEGAAPCCSNPDS